MASEFDKLLKEIRVTSASAFNGGEFQYREFGDSNPLDPMVSGAVRNLSDFDPEAGMHVEITEQYALVLDDMGEPTPWHKLLLSWGQDDESYTIDLDTGNFDDGEDTEFDEEQTIAMARQVLRTIGVVRPERLPERPENDIKPLQDLVNFIDLLHDELGPGLTEMASKDHILVNVARHQAKGNQYKDSVYGHFQDHIGEKYGITAEEVDLAVEKRMLRYSQRRERRSIG